VAVLFILIRHYGKAPLQSLQLGLVHLLITGNNTPTSPYTEYGVHKNDGI